MGRRHDSFVLLWVALGESKEEGNWPTGHRATEEEDREGWGRGVCVGGACTSLR